MKKTRFTEAQIVAAIKEYEAGKSAADVCRSLGINKQTFYNWKNKYSGNGGSGSEAIEGAGGRKPQIKANVC